MYNFENVLVSDPLKIKRYNSPYYKKIYSICVLIPTLLAFSIVFFLIFFMSPRGMSMRQYQRDIYEWNKAHLADKMSTVQFSFKIMPYKNKNWMTQSMILMNHFDTPLRTEEEQILNNLLSYKQSYFFYNDTYQVFPSFKFTNTSAPQNSSEEYCLHLWWRAAQRDKSYIEGDKYKSINEQPACLNSKDKTLFKWGESDPSTGLAFQAWKETEEELWCTNLTCQYDCNLHGGTYKDGKCYKYEVMRRLCIRIDFIDSEKGSLDQIEYAGGCFENDEIEYYEAAELDKVYEFDTIPIEVRAKGDPYTVFAESHYNLGKDLTIFFWLSIITAGGALLLSFALAIMLFSIARISKIQGGPYVKDLHSYS